MIQHIAKAARVAQSKHHVGGLVCSTQRVKVFCVVPREKKSVIGGDLFINEVKLNCPIHDFSISARNLNDQETISLDSTNCFEVCN